MIETLFDKGRIMERDLKNCREISTSNHVHVPLPACAGKSSFRDEIPDGWTIPPPGPGISIEGSNLLIPLEASKRDSVLEEVNDVIDTDPDLSSWERVRVRRHIQVGLNRLHAMDPFQNKVVTENDYDRSRWIGCSFRRSDSSLFLIRDYRVKIIGFEIELVDITNIDRLEHDRHYDADDLVESFDPDDQRKVLKYSF